MAEEVERVYTVPLAALEKPRGRRAMEAVKLLRAFLARHMKTSAERIRLDSALNAIIWARGMKKPPRRVRVLARKDREGNVRVLPAEGAVRKAEAGGG